MKIAYCTNVRLPSERAHGHQIAQVCDALAKLGHDVTIFTPFRKNTIQQDYWSYYHANSEVEVRKLGSFDPIQGWIRPRIIGLLLLNAGLREKLRQLLRTESFDLLYTRTPALLRALFVSGAPVILELHSLPRFGKSVFVDECNRCHRVVCLTSPMRDQLQSWGVKADKLMVAGDAVDLTRFMNQPTREEARKRLSIKTNRPVIGYVGRLTTLGMEKGVSDLLEALALLKKEKPVFGFIVGGPPKDVQRYKDQAQHLKLSADDVIFTGSIPANDVPTALAACDILVMAFPDLPHYRTNMSPLKLFEYMAANRPIVTTDLPTIRDVLSEHEAFFCQPGHVPNLVKTIGTVLENPSTAIDRAATARKLVEEHTWEKRMERILSR